jgi:uncharacterized lipoprotein YddW (UPF0748 family)
MSYVTWWQTVYQTLGSDRSLRNLADTGTEWLSLVVTGYQETITSTIITRTLPATPADEDLVHVIARAHSMGMKVMLKPHVDFSNDPNHWRGEIGFDNEADWAAWFASYRDFIFHYAELAESNGVEQFCVGTELMGTSYREEDWRSVIAGVRERFSGTLTYASNPGEETQINWWDALDYIGVDAYYALTDKDDPTVDELKAAWAPHVTTLANLATAWGKPILLTEIGYRSVDGTNQHPWEWWTAGTVDLQEQADCYRAAFETFWNKPWFAGMYWWHWSTDPEQGGENDSDYTPHNKPAEGVLRAYYLPEPEDWTRTARIATPYDYPDDPQWQDAIDRAVADGANVILDWADFSDTYPGRVLNPAPGLVDLQQRVEYVHTHHPGVRMIVYIAPLEMQTPDADMDMDGQPDPGVHTAWTDHPDWLQMGIDGRRAVFYGSMPGMPFWVDPTDEDVWLCPNNAEYRGLIMSLAADIAATGVDGVWFDVPFFVHDFGEGWQAQWPCHCPVCRAKFQADTGYTLPEPPSTPNWDDPAWRAFVAWRYEQTNDFIVDFGAALKAVNPEVQLIIETSVGPEVSAIQHGNSPLDLPGVSDLTAHEYGGPHTATKYYGWLAMLADLLFWRHTDGNQPCETCISQGQPSWLLSYVEAGHPDTVDVARLHAGSVLAAGFNYYTSGTEGMAGTPDPDFRRQLFGWLADHDDAYYNAGLRPYANVALLFSRQTLDYLDRGSWESDYAYHDEWRGMAMMLLESQVPYRVITEADLTAETLADYDALVLPLFGAMSPAQAQVIRGYVAGGGTIVATGETSLFDVQGQQLADFQLADVFGVSYNQADYEIVYVNDYGAGRSIFSLYPYPREYFWAAAPTWSGGNPAQAEAIRQAFLAEVWNPAAITPVLTTDSPRGVILLPFADDDELVVRVVNYVDVDTGDAVPTPQQGLSLTLTLPPNRSATAGEVLDFLGNTQPLPFTTPDDSHVQAAFDLDISAVLHFSTGRSPIHGAQVELYGLGELGVSNLIAQVKQAGANAIILRVFDYDEEPLSQTGVYFNTTHAPVKTDWLGPVIQEAHANGIRVYAWMTVLDFPWLIAEHPEWGVVAYDFDTGEYVTNANWYLRVSPFRPEHVQYLRDLYQDLAAYDIDGIMFQDDLYLAWNEDFSDYAKSAYQSRFGKVLDPLAMYTEDGMITPEGWQWAHWKAEQLLNLVSEIMDAVHGVNPDVKCALDTYGESVTEPDNGLFWVGQDVQLAVERGCDYIAVMSYHRGIAKEAGLTIDQAIEFVGAMTQEAIELVGADATVMKVQTEDFDTFEVIPGSEVGQALTTLTDAGCRNIIYYPHRSDLPFGVFRCHFAGTIFGDLDCDCDVDVADIMLVASHWHSSVGDEGYDPAYDLDDDGDVDIVDIMQVAVHWGETCETGVDKWSLWTGGTQLRGANIWQRRVYPELDGTEFLGPGPVGPPYTQEDFDRLAALGANYVNISHPGLFTETPPYVLDQDIQDNLDNLLAMIEQAGMFAVISFRTGPGRSEFTFVWDEVGDWFDESYLNDSMWQNQEAQDAWVAMWAYTAERYRDNPIVVGYDLMVEPNSNEVGSHALYDALDIWDPEEFYAQYSGTLYDWNQLYPRITAAIRQVDTETPILIGGNGYSSLDWLPYMEPTGDPRTVYTVHQYEPFKYTHQDAGVQECTYPGTCDVDWDDEPEPFDRAWLEGRLSIIDTYTSTYGVPVAVNEFGAVRWTPNVHTFMDDQMDLFEQRGMNYALWVWDPSWEPWTQEVDAFNFRHGPDPNNHTDVESSDLMDVIIEHWGRNTVRP